MKKIMFWALLISSIFFITACDHSNGLQNQLNINDLMASGQQEIKLGQGQTLEINNSSSKATWVATLGRRDFTKATFTWVNDTQNEKKLQKTLAFSQPGRYLITITSSAASHRPNVAQFQITAIVE